MKTDQWIEVLARGAGPAPTALAARRLSMAAAAGWAASAAMAVVMIGLLPAAAFASPSPWTKLAYCGLLALGAGGLTARMSRPGAAVARARSAVVAVALAMAVLGAIVLVRAPSGTRMQVLMGQTWWICPWGVLGLSVPALVASVWAVSGLAPTRPVRTGFAAGIFAGAVGACGYALACPETSPAFVAVWYSLGILLTGAAGAAIGWQRFRW